MFVRYGLAAVLAALATLMGNVVWAQESWPQGGFATGYAPPACCAEKPCSASNGCCATGACCKDGKCAGATTVCPRGCTSVAGAGAVIAGGESCCKGKKCGANCTCCKDNKCECGKDGKCCCKGQATDIGCCPFLGKIAKGTAIIMVMPSSLPLLGSFHAETMGMLPHPPMPMGAHMMFPMPLPPPPPMLTPPGLAAPGMTSPIMPPQTVALPHPIPVPPHCLPCPGQPVVLSNPPMNESYTALDTCLSLLGVASDLCSIVRPVSAPCLCASALGLLMERMSPIAYAQGPTLDAMHPGSYIPWAPSLPQSCGLGCPTTTIGTAPPSRDPPVCVCPYTTTAAPVMPCVGPSGVKPVTASKVRIIATPSTYSSELEMNIGDDTCIHCKKMTVKIGENEIIVSRFDDRVRVRGEELKATADSVHSNQKDNLILEGDVVLHYKKDGHSAHVTGDCIEVNLSSGAVTIKPAEKTLPHPSVRIDRVDSE